MQFLDEQQGWLITNHSLWWTNTGGKRWINVKLASQTGLFKDGNLMESMTGLQFFDSKKGWILEGSRLLETKDGGISWSETKLKNVLIRAFRFSDSARGYVVGEQLQRPKTNNDLEDFFPVIYKTSDGGRNWECVFKGESNHIPLYSVWPNSSSEVWVVGASILHSVDGGRNWEKVKIENWGNIGGIPFNIKFLDDKTGWILLNEPGGYLFTSDAGKTWLSRESPNPQLGFTDLIYINSNEIFAASRDIYYSNNQGLTWKPVIKGSYFSLQYLEKKNVVIAAGSSIAFLE
jgi:photosystem II stability/assembly factor-like uncharacterized protein